MKKIENNTYEIIQNKTFDEERALYGLKKSRVINCTFAGPADGESAFKESRGIAVENCNFSLRYPFWHSDTFTITKCNMDEYTRAAIWYAENGEIYKCNLNGIKALRECSNVLLDGCNVKSPEFGWRCKDIVLQNCNVVSEYFMFESKNLKFNSVKFDGKYSFQYVENAVIENCDFTTKDAFWHSKNVTVINSMLKGEYLGWYSEKLTLINCLIIGTQPLCYCKKLKLINCRTENCDLAFEYSDVNAEITGGIVSVKNPKSGKITAESVGEIIMRDAEIPCRGKVIIKP